MNVTVVGLGHLARPVLSDNAVLAESLQAAVAGADSILISNDDPLCAALPAMRRADGSPVAVFDYWRKLQPEDATRFDIRWF